MRWPCAASGSSRRRSGPSDELVDDILWVTDRWGHKITSEPKLRELRLSLILIEHFSSRLPRATDPEAALVHFSRFATETMAGPDWAEEFEALEKPEVLDALVRVLGESHFLWEDYLHAQPENILPMICDPAEWVRLPGQKQLSAGLLQALAGAEAAENAALAIRRFRDREIFRADMRSILGLSRGAEQFSAELTDVAEVVLRAVLGLAIEETRSRRPRFAPSPLPPSALFALGKFGGRELGFASDLEVLLVYDDKASVTGAGDPGAGSFFDGTVAAMRAVLGSREGHAFDLDFRLRPYGRAGSPATSLSTFLDYYRAGGPAWGYERQALIKLRFIGGDPTLGAAVETHRDRFVYGPEPFDLEGLRKMRRLQVDQLVQPGTINAKYSPGALVDVEYLVQALQIRHGSRDATLRSPNTLQALHALGAAGHLAPDQVRTLRSALPVLPGADRRPARRQRPCQGLDGAGARDRRVRAPGSTHAREGSPEPPGRAGADARGNARPHRPAGEPPDAMTLQVPRPRPWGFPAVSPSHPGRRGRSVCRAKAQVPSRCLVSDLTSELDSSAPVSTDRHQPRDDITFSCCNLPAGTLSLGSRLRRVADGRDSRRDVS